MVTGRAHARRSPTRDQATKGVWSIFSELGAAAVGLGLAAAVLIGFSKTGVPGAGLPAAAFMAEVFRHEDTRLSVGAMVPLLVLGDLFAIAYYRRHVLWNRLLELLPFVGLGMIPAYVVLSRIESEPLRLLIGSTILVLLALHVGRKRLGLESLADRRWFAGIMGFLAGFGTVIGNAAGPAMSIYLVSKKFDKHEFLGTTAWLFLLVNVSKIPFFAQLDMITAETLWFDLWMAPILVVGALLGVFVHKRIPQDVFNTLVLLLAGAAGLRMVLA
jgi:uncharacterized membrane protein YfcA